MLNRKLPNVDMAFEALERYRTTSSFLWAESGTSLLVALSACVTALGPEHSGEGLMSLSRAFQIAGARSVLASLWSVNDESTAELMIRFYRHLLSGMSKDEALRAAQSDLIRGPIPVPNQYGGVEMRDFTAPYYWAAFQLFGDWQ